MIISRAWKKTLCCSRILAKIYFAQKEQSCSFSRLSIHSIAFLIVYFQCTVLQRFKEAIFNEEETPQPLKPVLLKLCSLYGLWSLETHLTTLYQGQFTTSGDCWLNKTQSCCFTYQAFLGKNPTMEAMPPSLSPPLKYRKIPKISPSKYKPPKLVKQKTLR